jgi:hypothetical protein
MFFVLEKKEGRWPSNIIFQGDQLGAVKVFQDGLAAGRSVVIFTDDIPLGCSLHNRAGK